MGREGRTVVSTSKPMDAPAGPHQSPVPLPDNATEHSGFSPAHCLLAVIIARIYEILPLICPVCGSEMRLIAAVTEPEPVQLILRHLGETELPPPVSQARFQPLWDSVDWDQSPGQGPEAGEPAPEFQFDQTVSWVSSRFPHLEPTRPPSLAEPAIRRILLEQTQKLGARLLVVLRLSSGAPFLIVLAR